MTLRQQKSRNLYRHMNSKFLLEIDTIEDFIVSFDLFLFSLFSITFY